MKVLQLSAKETIEVTQSGTGGLDDSARVAHDPGDLPWLRGVEHVGVPVPDLEVGISWFCDVLGCQLIYRHGPYDFPPETADADNYFVTYLKARPDLRIEIAMLKCRSGANLELFGVGGLADGDEAMRRFPAMGTAHINFYVDDMQAAVGHLRDKGVEVLGGIAETADIEAGRESTNTHFLTPWGMMLEFTSFPHGRLFEQMTAKRPWMPPPR